MQEQDLVDFIKAIRYELQLPDPYKTDGGGCCPGCGGWNPESAKEADKHGHSDICGMMEGQRQWQDIRGRIEAVLKRQEELI